MNKISNNKKLNTLLNIISSRRSIRKFKKKEIPDSDIKTLIESAASAPSGGNMQPWHFIVIKNNDLKDKLVNITLDNIEKLELDNFILKDPLLYNASKVLKKYSTFMNNAPVVIAVLVKLSEGPLFNTIMKYMKTDKYDTSALMGFVEVQSVAAAIENLLLAAHAMGYGGCWVRVPFCSKNQLERELKVERPWHLLAFVPVGIADESPGSPKRKALEKIMTIINQ